MRDTRRDIRVISRCTDTGKTPGVVQALPDPSVAVVTTRAPAPPHLRTGVSTPGLQLGLSIRKLE